MKKKTKTLRIVLLALVIVALAAAGVLYLRWRATLPPEGEVEITTVQIYSNALRQEGDPSLQINSIFALWPNGKENTLMTKAGEWFEGATLKSVKRYGTISIQSATKGAVYASLPENGLIAMVYEMEDGTERTLLLTKGMRMQYKDGLPTTFHFPEPTQAQQALWDTIQRRGEEGEALAMHNLIP